MFQLKKTKPNRVTLGGLALFFCLILVNSSFALIASPIIVKNYPPTVVSVSPNSGSINTGQSISFKTTYSDLNGWQDIQYCYLLVNNVVNGANCFYAYFERSTKKLYLRNSANTAWVGGYLIGSSNIIENNQVKLNCSKTTVTALGKILGINWSITFKSSFTGTKNTYLYVTDKQAAKSGWVKKGTITIQIQDITPPVITINPVLSPTNQNVVLSYSVSDDLTPTDKIVVMGDNSPYTKEGTYNVTLIAKDLAGNSSSVQVSFTIDKTPPAIIIISPQNGAAVDDPSMQLQGTIDGVPFSENRILNEGENTLIKTATDLAGNTASASVSIYLHTGELIGPEGGEITSQDGKVKLIIPAAALTMATRIKIVPLENKDLNSATPFGKNLLSVVECQPSNTQFNKPVKLIYTLSQAQVPGTSVELGLFDGRQIVPTGQCTTVPADGYTLTFFIDHFSAYAALATLTPQSAPIGSGVKIPLPDLLTGSFSHAIPITVPPGRKGMQPALALNYHSSNGNSWLGMGFSLNPGYIVRSTRLGPAAYDDIKDTFYLMTDAGTTELVHLVDNVYQSKIESSFTKFIKQIDDSWRAVGKDGSVLRFGQDSNSKEVSTSGTFAWYLTKAVDTNANFIQYNYMQDQGKSYLSGIDYTGNDSGISPANHIEFFLESRSDSSSSYVSTSRIATTKRLKEIQVSLGYDLVWRYELEYSNSPDTNRSLLKSITQFAADNKSMLVQRLDYQKAN